MTICRQCTSAFEITNEDLAFYDKVSPVFNDKKELIPPPTLCPDCRLQRRLAFRNVRALYHRKSDMTGKQMISMYAPEKPCPVFEQSEWFSDAWDAKSYGKDLIDPQSFFPLFQSLSLEAPRWNKIVISCDNCDYCVNCAECKNCYLLVSSAGSQDCFYSMRTNKCKNCVDCLRISESELCYECLDCERLYGCRNLQLCKQCINCSYCFECEVCSDCLLCAGLRQKQYCIYNEQFTKEEYEQRKAAILEKGEKFLRQELMRVHGLIPHPAHRNMNCEQCSGDFLFNCKNVHDSFFVSDSTDSAYILDGTTTTDSMDCSDPVDFSLCYEISSSYQCYASAFCENTVTCSECFFCRYCDHCKNCFGCVGLRNSQYCILNKQYTKEEYEELVPQIIKSLREQGHWGEFFPVEMTMFEYNESVAQEYFPLSKEEALLHGWRWREETTEQYHYMGPAYEIPERIDDISDDITTYILTCDVTGRPYKIIPQELTFYRQMNIAIPRKCPDQRHKERSALRNPCKLWDRSCANCQKAIQTTYAPNRPEIVYCEECYLSTIY